MSVTGKGSKDALDILVRIKNRIQVHQGELSDAISKRESRDVIKLLSTRIMVLGELYDSEKSILEVAE